MYDKTKIKRELRRKARRRASAARTAARPAAEGEGTEANQTSPSGKALPSNVKTAPGNMEGREQQREAARAAAGARGNAIDPLTEPPFPMPSTGAEGAATDATSIFPMSDIDGCAGYVGMVVQCTFNCEHQQCMNEATTIDFVMDSVGLRSARNHSESSNSEGGPSAPDTKGAAMDIDPANAIPLMTPSAAPVDPPLPFPQDETKRLVELLGEQGPPPKQHPRRGVRTAYRDGLQCIIIVGDGHCFYRAVSQVVYGHQEHHPQLRRQLHQHMTANPHLSSRTPQEFLQYVQDKGPINPRNVRQWATDVEIFFMAHLLRTPFHIYRTQRPNQPAGWHFLHPQFIDPLASTSAAPICLINKKDHFDLIVGSQRQPPVDRSAPLQGPKLPGPPLQPTLPEKEYVANRTDSDMDISSDSETNAEVSWDLDTSTGSQQCTARAGVNKPDTDTDMEISSDSDTGGSEPEHIEMIHNEALGSNSTTTGTEVAWHSDIEGLEPEPHEVLLPDKPCTSGYNPPRDNLWDLGRKVRDHWTGLASENSPVKWRKSFNLFKTRHGPLSLPEFITVTRRQVNIEGQRFTKKGMTPIGCPLLRMPRSVGSGKTRAYPTQQDRSRLEKLRSYLSQHYRVRADRNYEVTLQSVWQLHSRILGDVKTIADFATLISLGIPAVRPIARGTCATVMLNLEPASEVSQQHHPRPGGTTDKAGDALGCPVRHFLLQHYSGDEVNGDIPVDSMLHFYRQSPHYREVTDEVFLEAVRKLVITTLVSSGGRSAYLAPLRPITQESANHHTSAKSRQAEDARSVQFYLANIRGLITRSQNKCPYVEEITNRQGDTGAKSKVVVLTETWTKDKYQGEILEYFKDHNVMMTDRTYNPDLSDPHQIKTRGGTMILTSPDIPITPKLKRSNGNCEVAIARLHTIDALVISLYRPSGKNFAISKFQEALSWISEFLTDHAEDLQETHIALMGDFNFPKSIVQWTESRHGLVADYSPGDSVQKEELRI